MSLNTYFLLFSRRLNLIWGLIFICLSGESSRGRKYYFELKYIWPDLRNIYEIYLARSDPRNIFELYLARSDPRNIFEIYLARSDLRKWKTRISSATAAPPCTLCSVLRRVILTFYKFHRKRMSETKCLTTLVGIAIT